MDAKEAIALAKNYVRDVYTDEPIDQVGLEEVEFDDRNNQWLVTIGFTRRWNDQSFVGMVGPVRRSYKVISLAEDGTVRSLKDRQTDSVGA